MIPDLSKNKKTYECLRCGHILTDDEIISIVGRHVIACTNCDKTNSGIPVLIATLSALIIMSILAVILVALQVIK